MKTQIRTIAVALLVSSIVSGLVGCQYQMNGGAWYSPKSYAWKNPFKSSEAPVYDAEGMAHAKPSLGAQPNVTTPPGGYGSKEDEARFYAGKKDGSSVALQTQYGYEATRADNRVATGNVPSNIPSNVPSNVPSQYPGYQAGTYQTGTDAASYYAPYNNSAPAQTTNYGGANNGSGYYGATNHAAPATPASMGYQPTNYYEQQPNQQPNQTGYSPYAPPQSAAPTGFETIPNVQPNAQLNTQPNTLQNSQPMNSVNPSTYAPIAPQGYQTGQYPAEHGGYTASPSVYQPIMPNGL